MKKWNKSPRENVKDLSGYLKYAAKFKDQPGVIDDLNFMYEMFSDPLLLHGLINSPEGLAGVLNFASIGVLTRIEELLEEEKNKHQMNRGRSS
jgi:hypothetical protein